MSSKEEMTWAKSKLKAVLFTILNAIIFMIPLIVIVIWYRDEFFTVKSGTSVAGVGIIGLIIYILGLKHMLQETPKILWYVIIVAICYFLSSISEWMVTFSIAMLIGYVMSIPLSIYVSRLNKEADAIDDATTRYKVRQQLKGSKASSELVEIDVEDAQ